MAENPASAEDAAAGLLNGLMITLLGSAFPVVFIWQLVSRWKSDPVDLSLASLSDLGPVVGLAIFSLLFVRTGVRLLRDNMRYFRRRPDVPSPE